ncbi:class I SAM-dependent methyltransferase [Parvularcula sp. ZS-1/3]|uniref:Class I SAM-dependent methyltransferase n=1 Tax=Parvularcula mediterranea TaxID=2732508 RepID=A0A7Y3W536_9PROT|nr:class I SAM-dependent methyltransferase [Parvularcula mediterranea]NNU16385.1 class I SAM-dependent methyltransferase [Parvularcula mediterranea]
MGLAANIETKLREAQYRAATTAKVGWFTSFYVMGRHIVGPLTSPGEVPKATPTEAPSMGDMRASFFKLFDDEWADVEAKRYRMPREFRTRPDPVAAVRKARNYLDEARAVARRSKTKGGGTEVRETAPDGLPAYYRQNFHFQSDGWLSEESASVYDTQVEVLFTGSADAMRRRALPAISEEVRRLVRERGSEKDIHFADVACGTGRLLSDVADNFPELTVSAVDLSGPYLEKARANNAHAKNASFIEAAAEKLPFEDGSVDILTTVYLFHELPPKVRREVAAEVARVLRPGGLYVHVDSAQYGDTCMDALLEGFPKAFHEPFYDSYAREDLPSLFGESGLEPDGQRIGFLTKASSFRKPN